MVRLVTSAGLFSTPVTVTLLKSAGSPGGVMVNPASGVATLPRTTDPDNWVVYGFR